MLRLPSKEKEIEISQGRARSQGRTSEQTASSHQLTLHAVKAKKYMVPYYRAPECYYCSCYYDCYCVSILFVMNISTGVVILIVATIIGV